MELRLKYQEWEPTVPAAITDDALWRLKVYRFALFASDLSWEDVRKVSNSSGMRAVADQLYRAMGSIGANIAEGYSRSSGKDRVRFYEYALGSARECRHWYYMSRHVLTQSVLEHRLQVLAEILRILLSIIPEERKLNLREEGIDYNPHAEDSSPDL